MAIQHRKGWYDDHEQSKYPPRYLLDISIGPSRLGNTASTLLFLCCLAPEWRQVKLCKRGGHTNNTYLADIQKCFVFPRLGDKDLIILDEYRQYRLTVKGSTEQIFWLCHSCVLEVKKFRKLLVDAMIRLLFLRRGCIVLTDML